MGSLSIQELLGEKEAGLNLELLAGQSGLGNLINVPRIQKPGLALAGYTPSLHADRAQVRTWAVRTGLMLLLQSARDLAKK